MVLNYRIKLENNKYYLKRRHLENSLLGRDWH